MSEITPTPDNLPTFEDFKKENGISYWWASDLMRMLNYNDMKSFEKAIERATKALMALNIKHYENIVPQQNPESGIQDFKLTRFACYLTVMNADVKKTEVAAAQAYFAAMTARFEEVLKKNDDVERLIIRDEIKDGNKSLNSIAKAQGLSDYARFANSGYLGLYNMYNWQLANKRGIDKTKLFEYMGRTELAANLFRITMTEEKIKNENIHGQSNLENAHYNVGRQVRAMVEKNVGTSPENLKQQEILPEVKKDLKKISKDIKKLDE